MRRHKDDLLIDWMDMLTLAWDDGVCSGWHHRNLRVGFRTTWGWLTASWRLMFSPDTPEESK